MKLVSKNTVSNWTVSSSKQKRKQNICKCIPMYICVREKWNQIQNCPKFTDFFDSSRPWPVNWGNFHFHFIWVRNIIPKTWPATKNVEIHNIIVERFRSLHSVHMAFAFLILLLCLFCNKALSYRHQMPLEFNVVIRGDVIDGLTNRNYVWVFVRTFTQFI